MTAPQTPTGFAAINIPGSGPPWGSGYGPQFYIDSSRNFRDENGKIFIPNGLNFDGLEDVTQLPGSTTGNYFYGWPSGAPGTTTLPILSELNGASGNPRWAMPTVQMYLSVSGILGLTTYDTNGGGPYVPTLTATQYLTGVAQAIVFFQQNFNARVWIGVRNNAPRAPCGSFGVQPLMPGNQNTMLDALDGLAAIQSLGNWFGSPNGSASALGVNLGGVGLVCYNEPVVGNPASNLNGGNNGIYNGLNGGLQVGVNCSIADVWGIIMGTQGYGGYTLQTFSDVSRSGPNGYGTYSYNYPWQVAGCQQIINTFRATGACNPIMLDAPNYTNPTSNQTAAYNFGGWQWILNNPQYLPTDPLTLIPQPGGPPPASQLCMAWHVYNFTGDSLPGSGTGGAPGNMWADFVTLDKTLMPGIIAECGDADDSGWISPVLTWAANNGIGVIPWSMNPGQGYPQLLTSGYQPTNNYGSIVQPATLTWAG